MPETPIGPGTRVKLRFSLKLEDGTLVDSTGENDAEFEVGDGKLLPGFEQALFGLKAGDAESLLIEAEKGFGLSVPENIQIMPKSRFPPHTELAEGLMLSFADQQKTELPGIITRIEDTRVSVDFNHPLADRDLIFDVEIVTVRQVSDEILRVKS